MSESTANLRRKIATAGDLQSVVRSMKAVAASQISQYEQSVRALGDYFRAIELGLGLCLRQNGPAASSLLHGSPRGAALGGVAVFGSDQGLVGQFNELVAARAVELLLTMPRGSRVWAVGERVQAHLVAAGMPAPGLLAVPMSVGAIAPLVGRILLETEAHRGREQSYELQLVYNRQLPSAGFEPVTIRLLPLDDLWHHKLAAIPWPGNPLAQVLGDADTTLRALLHEYLFIALFRACAESLASENASRLSAMQRADSNIEDVLGELHNSFHRLRQSSIDEELFDVISGFEAISATRANPARHSSG